MWIKVLILDSQTQNANVEIIEMIIPSITHHGRKNVLVLELKVAIASLADARYAVLQTTPQRCDYDGNFMSAIGEHVERIKRIDAVKDELGQLAEAIEKM